jgi:hypothetical protein
LQPSWERDTLFKVLPHLKNKTSIFVDKPDLEFYQPKTRPFIPVEFSIAAYRWVLHGQAHLSVE